MNIEGNFLVMKGLNIVTGKLFDHITRKIENSKLIRRRRRGTMSAGR